MKIIAAIQARMGSTRFPGKVMKDQDICRYIRCSYFSFYNLVKGENRCFEIGACEKINKQKERWRKFPFSRPGVVFTENQKKVINNLIEQQKYGDVQIIIFNKLKENK